MSKKITQRDRVLQYIRDFGFITSWQAYEDLGISQLGARIYELKELGYEFETATKTKRNRYGEKVRFAVYRLAGEPNA